MILMSDFLQGQLLSINFVPLNGPSVPDSFYALQLCCCCWNCAFGYYNVVTLEIRFYFSPLPQGLLVFSVHSPSFSISPLPLSFFDAVEGYNSTFVWDCSKIFLQRLYALSCLITVIKAISLACVQLVFWQRFPEMPGAETDTKQTNKYAKRRLQNEKTASFPGLCRLALP